VFTREKRVYFFCRNVRDENRRAATYFVAQNLFFRDNSGILCLAVHMELRLMTSALKDLP